MAEDNLIFKICCFNWCQINVKIMVNIGIEVCCQNFNNRTRKSAWQRTVSSSKVSEALSCRWGWIMESLIGLLFWNKYKIQTYFDTITSSLVFCLACYTSVSTKYLGVGIIVCTKALNRYPKFDISDFIDKLKFYLMIIDNHFHRIISTFFYRLRALLHGSHFHS